MLALTTKEVADFFWDRAAGIDPSDEVLSYLPEHYAPAAAESFAKIPIDGDLGEILFETADENWPSNWYSFWDLKEVPIGGKVWRVSCLDTRHEFKRVADDCWEYQQYRKK